MLNHAFTSFCSATYLLHALAVILSVYGQCAHGASDEIESDDYIIAGHVIYSDYPVFALDHMGYERRLSLRSNLFVFDTIETQANRILQVRLRDGAIFELAHNSIISIGEFYDNDEGAIVRSEMHLRRGKLQLFSGIGVKNNALRLIRTPFGVIESKNAMFTIAFMDKLVVTVHSGEVELSNAYGKLVLGSSYPFKMGIVEQKTTAPQGWSPVSVLGMKKKSKQS